MLMCGGFLLYLVFIITSAESRASHDVVDIHIESVDDNQGVANWQSTKCLCDKKDGFCIKSGDNCNGTIEILHHSDDDQCCCCIEKREPPPVICHKMGGFCIKNGENCNGTFEIIHGFGHDQCCCCLPKPEPTKLQCDKKNGSCIKSGDHCNGTIDILHNSGDDQCCCCLPLPPVQNSLCEEMHGYCQRSDDFQCLGMSINNITLNTKYCGDSCKHCCAPSGQVFIADIENSLSYALRFIKPNLNGTTNNTYTELNSTTCADLKKFIKIIHIYLKIDQHIQGHTHRFIEQLHHALNHKGDNFNFAWLEDQFNITQNLSPSNTFINGEWQPSVSCHNIYEDNCFWRYTCGLWNIFHTLTVSADKSTNPLEVLKAIHGYVVNFLGCDICGPHFGHMYEQTIVKYGDSIVDTTDKAILWLWCAHNVVNQRNTSHPSWKIHPQFPIKSVCPSCWRGTTTTTCPELFCKGNTDVGYCFQVEKDLNITYDPFSIPAVLLYLKGTYGGSYSNLKTNTVWQSLDFDPNATCPIYNNMVFELKTT